MRYKIEGVETLVRSENSAKPANAGSRYVKQWITMHPHVICAVDYGCGKLRYTLDLAKRAGTIYAVDSKVQLERLQSIHGTGKTSVIEFLKKSQLNINPITVEKFTDLGIHAQLILCTNVLSAIPFHEDRSGVVGQIARTLSSDGHALVSVQHRNSDFNRVRRIGRARQYGDGYLIENGSWHSFYGLLSKEYLVRLVSDAGLQVEQAWIKDQSTYILAGPQEPRSRDHDSR